MSGNPRVAALLADPRLWTARDLAQAPTAPSGHARLDAELPGGGWPCGALTELLLERPGIGELTLLAPALAQLSAQGQRIALVNPPYRACAPAWVQLGVALEQLLLIEAPSPADGRWCAEQALRSRGFGAVLAWPRAAGERDLRRLQLAAEEGGALAFLFRPPAAARQSSPAALRLQLSAGLQIQILKSRGGRPRTVQLPIADWRLPIKKTLSLSNPSIDNRQSTIANAVAMPLPAAPAARCAG
jgi:hypothetical protein